jgi:hypothetical protein
MYERLGPLFSLHFSAKFQTIFRFLSTPKGIVVSMEIAVVYQRAGVPDMRA